VSETPLELGICKDSSWGGGQKVVWARYLPVTDS